MNADLIAKERWQEWIKDDRVSGHLYTDDAVFQAELEKIWYTTWVYVGHESEISEPGDYVTRHIGRQPVILSRDEGGEVHLLMNRCSHRGNLVCQEEQGQSHNFVCQYHGWTFSNDGRLVGATYSQGYGEDFRKDDLGLTKVPRLDSYGGFIFGSLSPSGTTLEEHLGLAKRYIDEFLELSPERKIELRAGSFKHDLRGNWKLAFENNADNYHTVFLHRSALREFAKEGVTYAQILGDKGPVVTRDLGNGHMLLDYSEQNRVSGATTNFARGGKGTDADVAEYHRLLRDEYGEDKAKEILGRGMSILMVFPNLSLTFQDVRLFQPISAGRTLEFHSPALLAGVPAGVNAGRVRAEVTAYGPAGFIGSDDADLYERIQIGVGARVNDWMILQRGLHRETQEEDGSRTGRASDETSQRGFWREYKTLMASSRDGSVESDGS